MPEDRINRNNKLLTAAAYFFAAAVCFCFLFYVRRIVLVDHDTLYEFVLARLYDFKYAFDRALNFNLRRGRIGVIFPFVVAVRYFINGTGNYTAIWLLQYVPVVANVAFIAYILRKVFGKGYDILFTAAFFGLVQINRWHCLIICYPLDFMYGLFIMDLGIWLFYLYLSEEKTGIKHNIKFIISAICLYESFQVYEPFFVSVAIYGWLTLYFAFKKEKALAKRAQYFIKKLWLPMIAGIIFLIFYYIHLHSSFVEDSPSYPVGHNIKDTLYTWGVFSGGMFPLIYFFYPQDAREMIGADFAPTVFKVVISVATMIASWLGTKLITIKKDMRLKSEHISFAICAAVIALFYALPHSLTVLYQEWVLSGSQAGYVPTAICYYGWIAIIVIVIALIAAYIPKGKKAACIIIALAIGTGTYLTYSINDGFKSIRYGQSEAECLKDQAFYSLIRSDIFREEGIDLLYTPQFMGIHNATETNEELAEYESGNVLDLTKYGDEFDDLFDSYEHPAMFVYDWDNEEGILYLYADDGDHEPDRTVIIPINR